MDSSVSKVICTASNKLALQFIQSLEFYDLDDVSISTKMNFDYHIKDITCYDHATGTFFVLDGEGGVHFTDMRMLQSTKYYVPAENIGDNNSVISLFYRSAENLLV